MIVCMTDITFKKSMYTLCFMIGPIDVCLLLVVCHKSISSCFWCLENTGTMLPNLYARLNKQKLKKKKIVKTNSPGV